METSLVIGLKTNDLQAVADALAAQSGTTILYHDSLYKGEYCRLEMPEEVQVRPNYVDVMDDWTEELHQDMGVLIFVDGTERPEYFEDLASDLGFEAEVIQRYP